MLTAADCIERTRPLLRALVEAEEKVCGSTMTAYRTIARRAGSSLMKIRRILGRYDGVKLEAHEFYNIHALHALHQRYERAVEKQRQGAEDEKLLLTHLRGQYNALNLLLDTEDVAPVPRESAGKENRSSAS